MENKTKEYEENIKRLNEQIENQKKENDKMNDENTSLSKFLADKNREIQLLQNSIKLKINELNKLKLIVKTNEKQLKVKKLKADQKKANSPNNLKIKDLLGSSQKIHDINSNSNNNSPNVSTNNENNNIFNKETISKLEEEIKDLKEEIEKNKEEIEKAKEEKESLTTNINALEKDISNKINENEILENELSNKNNKIEDENKIINELKSEKDKLILKLKEYKNSEDLYLSQIKILKEHIKKLEKQLDSDKNISLKKKELIKKISDLEIEITNIKMQLEIELKFNGQLKNNLKSKSEQIDELNLIINDLMKEKEKFTLMKSSSQVHNIQNNIISNNNKNVVFNRSKTKEESDRVKIEDNVKKSVNKNVEKEKEKVENNSQKMEFKTDKNLEKYKLNEYNKNEKQNDDYKSEDMKVDFNKN
jgi:chromosome segregation ATPase